MTETDIAEFVDAYLLAWRSNDADDIRAVFTEDAEYHEEPYETHWIGREEIVRGWRSRWNWQQGGWSFEWTLRSIDGRTAVIVGTGRYTELGVFDNVWTVTFADNGRVSRFHMVNTERA